MALMTSFSGVEHPPINVEYLPINFFFCQAFESIFDVSDELDVSVAYNADILKIIEIKSGGLRMQCLVG